MELHFRLPLVVVGGLCGIFATCSCTGSVAQEGLPYQRFLNEVGQTCGIVTEAPSYVAAAVQAGLLRFNAERANECVTWLKTYGCPSGGLLSGFGFVSSDQAFPSGCRESLRGWAEIGTPCKDTVECVASAFCESESCVSYARAGDTCKTYSSCEAGPLLIPVCQENQGAFRCTTAMGANRHARVSQPCGLMSSETGLVFEGCQDGLYCSDIAGTCLLPYMSR